MADISSGWSDWQWDSSRSLWYAYRVGPDGEYEYDYQHTDAAGDQSQTPRYAGTQITQGSSTGQSRNSYTDYRQNNRDAATRRPVSSMSPSANTYYNSTVASPSRDHTVAQNWTQPTTTGMTVPAFDGYRNPAPYSQTSEYTHTRSTAVPSSVDSVANSLSRMSFAPRQAQGAQAQQSGPGLFVHKHIYKAPNTGNSEKLDPLSSAEITLTFTGYQSVPENEQDSFFRVGRVFMMLWTEPARNQPVNKVPYGGGSRNGSHFSTTFLGGAAYSEIRRPIHTYSGHATLKHNLPDVQQHTMIYTTENPPAPHWYYAEDGSVVQEQLTKVPIRVVSQQSSPEGELDPKSRLNYSKIYTVEHYVRVLNIGMVHNDSMMALATSSPYQRTEPSQKPKTNPPPAGSDKNKRKSSRT
ncbi:heterokaryon incompatibility protein [Rutstroemia sp. NJR-2017a WRK4]|nr:heterokaryon incompatibility protein [Rutstroemia sp. NJR-2017a WRK4]